MPSRISFPSRVTRLPPTDPTSVAVLTHGLQLANQLLLGPFRPLLLVGVDGTKDGTARLPTVFDGRDVQVMHQYDIWILEREQKHKDRCSDPHTTNPLNKGERSFWKLKLN